MECGHVSGSGFKNKNTRLLTGCHVSGVRNEGALQVVPLRAFLLPRSNLALGSVVFSGFHQAVEGLVDLQIELSLTRDQRSPAGASATNVAR